MKFINSVEFKSIYLSVNIKVRGEESVNWIVFVLFIAVLMFTDASYLKLHQVMKSTA